MIRLTDTCAVCKPSDTLMVVVPPVEPTAVIVKIPLVDDAGETVAMPVFALTAV